MENVKLLRGLKHSKNENVNSPLFVENISDDHNFYQYTEPNKSTEDRLAPTNFILGYGSTINSESRHATGGINVGNAVPVYVKTSFQYRRYWNFQKPDVAKLTAIGLKKVLSHKENADIGFKWTKVEDSNLKKGECVNNSETLTAAHVSVQDLQRLLGEKGSNLSFNQIPVNGLTENSVVQARGGVHDGKCFKPYTIAFNGVIYPVFGDINMFDAREEGYTREKIALEHICFEGWQNCRLYFETELGRNAQIWIYVPKKGDYKPTYEYPIL